MRLSVFSDYSLRVLMYTAVKNESLVTTREICDYYKISYNHLVKVVHKLSKTGFLKVRKGNKGGFQLAVRPEDIKLGEIIRAVEPDFNLVECYDQKNNRCTITPFCRMKKELDKAFSAFFLTLDNVTIADVIKENRAFW